MPVAPTDLTARLSGGAANADVNASLGGVISSVPVDFGSTLNNLFDNVSDAEAIAGDVEYRCFYLRNGHATDTLNTTTVYVASNTPNANTAVQIGLDPAGVGDGVTTGVAAVAADEQSAPAGVTFSNAATAGAALAIGTLTAGQVYAIWIKRTVTAGAAASPSDPFTLRVTGTPA